MSDAPFWVGFRRGYVLGHLVGIPAFLIGLWLF